MARIGILGGTFNPIHLGHIQIAYGALEQFHLDEVIFLVAGTPPHKAITDDISAHHRLEMVKVAIAKEPRFRADDMEIRKGGKSYTYQTLQFLHEKYPEHEYYFIIGEDSLASFEEWKHPEIISSCAVILAAVRQDRKTTDSLQFERELEHCRSMFGEHFYGLRVPNFVVSSTQIRESFYKDECVRDWISPEVYKYILRHGLYKVNQKKMDFDKLKKCLKKELTKERYQHTIGVMYTAASLAMKYGYPMEDAMLAGLLHDCAKCLSDNERLKICDQQNISVTEIEKKHPHLLHAKVGACLAQKAYGVEDEDILHAIRVHTTGCADMNLLDQIIYVSDYIEPGRDKAPRLSDIRQMAFTDLNRCCAMIFQDTVEYLSSSSDMDPTTLEAYEFYKKFL